MADRLVVIGADAAGMSAATNARRGQPYLEIVALEKGEWTSYSACGIPYLVGGELTSIDDLVARTPQQLREQHRIDVRLHHEVVGVDLTSGQLEVRDRLRQRTITMGFDRLHIATGARPFRPDVPGVDGDDVFGVQTLDDAKVLLERARLTGSQNVVVIGAGYLGLEMAEAFVRRGAKVTLLDAGEQVMRTLDRDVADKLVAPLRGLGVDVRLNVEVEAIDGGQVVTASDTITADLVVLGIGVRPNADIAGQAGIELGPSGAIAVNRRQQTSAEGVYSAGDCAEAFHLVAGHPVHIALGTVANKAGRVAGINIGGGYATFPGVLGTAITKVCEIEVARTGLTEREAITEGFKPVAVTVDTTARAGYLPDPGSMAVKLVAEAGTGRLLGAQILGEGKHVGQAAKRIDTVAVALHAGMGAAELVDADLAYAPPFSSVWDPVQVAARKLTSEL
jgi:NADPH-dependent 2,4-dienoyl-CoA reductase/sulfur reductase-like enzyme